MNLSIKFICFELLSFLFYIFNIDRGLYRLCFLNEGCEFLANDNSIIRYNADKCILSVLQRTLVKR